MGICIGLCLALSCTGARADDGPEVKWAQLLDGGVWYKNYRKIFGRRNPSCLTIATDEVQSKVLGAYYLHYSGLGECRADRLADALKFTFRDGVRYIPPSSVAFSALMHWSDAQAPRTQLEQRSFLRLARWLLAHQKDGRWLWPIRVPERGIEPPWISAYTQAYGISVMLRAYQLTGLTGYRNAAHRAMYWLALPTSQGGTVEYQNNGAWLEEYPNAKKPSHVLNGHLAAMLGVWDYYRATGDERAKQLFHQAAAVVKAEMGRYDLGYWLVYDQLNRVDVMNGSYMDYIEKNLRILGAITRDPFFSDYANKVSNYVDSEALFAKMARDEYKRQRPSINK